MSRDGILVDPIKVELVIKWDKLSTVFFGISMVLSPVCQGVLEYYSSTYEVD